MPDEKDPYDNPVTRYAQRVMEMQSARERPAPTLRETISEPGGLKRATTHALGSLGGHFPEAELAADLANRDNAHAGAQNVVYDRLHDVSAPLAQRVVSADDPGNGKAGWVERASGAAIRATNRALEATKQYRGEPGSEEANQTANFNRASGAFHQRPSMEEAQLKPIQQHGRSAMAEGVAGGESGPVSASSQMLDQVRPVSFNYKPGFGSPERHYGVLAQDLERSPMGASLVTPNAQGVKQVNVPKAAMANMAATADLHQRVKALEANSGGVDADAAKRMEERADGMRRSMDAQLGTKAGGDRMQAQANDMRRSMDAQFAAPSRAAAPRISDNKASQMQAQADGMRRSMDAQFATSDEVVKDDIKREGISPQEAYASRVRELTDDAKLGAPEAPKKLEELTSAGEATGIAGAVQRTAKTAQHDWAVEDELARHNKTLLRAPKNYRDEGAIDIAESPGGTRILSRLTGANGKTTEPGLSRDVPGLVDNTPAAQRERYRQMVVRNASLTHHGMAGDAMQSQADDMRRSMDAQFAAPSLTQSRGGPTGMDGPVKVADYAKKVMAGVPAQPYGLGSNGGVNNDPHKHDIPLQKDLDAEHAQMQADYDKYKAEHDAPRPPMMGIGKKGAESEGANIPEGMEIGPKGGLVPKAEEPKKPEAVDPSTLANSSETAPVRQPVDIVRGDDNDRSQGGVGLPQPGTATIPAHYEDQIGPEAWGLLSDAEKARFTAADSIRNRSLTQTKADEQIAEEQLGEANRSAIRAGNMQSDLAPQHDDLEAKARDILKSSADLANYHEDPNHFWNSKSTFQKVMGFIGVILGGFTSSRNGGHNSALEQINRAQDADIAAQRHAYAANKDSLEAKRSAFGMAMERYKGDEHAATTAVRLAQLDRIDAMARKEAAQHKGTEVDNHLDMFLGDSADLRAKEVINYKKWVQERAVRTGPDMNGLLKDYGKYHDNVLEKLHAGEGGTPPLSFQQWVQGRLGGTPSVPEGAVVGPHTAAGKDGPDQPMVHTPEGEYQARSKDDAKEYKQRMEGADEFEAAIKAISEIRKKGSSLSPSDRAAAESAAVAAKNAFVKGEGFHRTPAQTEFEALDRIVPAQGGQMSMTADRQLAEAQKIVARWRETARKNYLVPSDVDAAPPTPKTFRSK